MAIGAITAMLGVLLNLLLGLSRVLLAMGRRGDMPHSFAAISRKTGVPWIATLVVAAIIAGLIFIGDVRVTWSFSAFTVLIYYAITNLCALRLTTEQRLFPIWPAYCGLAACGFLAFWVDWQIWFAGIILIIIGGIWHWIAQRVAGDHGANSIDPLATRENEIT
jgi:APA family basic amino acid/polyamine antiporter